MVRRRIEECGDKISDEQREMVVLAENIISDYTRHVINVVTEHYRPQIVYITNALLLNTSGEEGILLVRKHAILGHPVRRGLSKD